MRKAIYRDRGTVVDILTRAFDTNKSVNSVIKQDKHRVNRMKELMTYSFEVCFQFGEVFLSSDNKACALALLPDQKRTTIKSLLWDARLIYKSIGITNVTKVLKRELEIRKMYPKEPMYHLWFGGVDPKYQHQGIGTKLLNDLIQKAVSSGRSIFLETSTIENLPLYQRCGFEIYQELELGYKLYLMRR